MKIKMTTAMAGNEFDWRPGEVIEVADDEALRYIENGLAVEVVEEKPAPTKK